MCGRFAQHSPLVRSALRFEAVLKSSLRPRYNVAPGQKAVLIRWDARKGIRRLEDMTWGLVPPWAAEKKDAHPLINARAETLSEKPSFKEAFLTRRCLVPADGFYEWKKEGEEKKPYYFSMKDKKVFAMAGLWESYTKDKKVFTTFTIITTRANELIAPLHERMPVILPLSAVAVWLDPNLSDPSVLRRYLQPSDPGSMEVRPLSPYVNDAKNEGPDCLC